MPSLRDDTRQCIRAVPAQSTFRPHIAHRKGEFMRGFRRLLALSATLVVALAAFTVGTAPAQAAASGPPCRWTASRTASNCDGIVMDDALWEACGREAIATVYWLRIIGPGDI